MAMLRLLQHHGFSPYDITPRISGDNRKQEKLDAAEWKTWTHNMDLVWVHQKAKPIL